MKARSILFQFNVRHLIFQLHHETMSIVGETLQRILMNRYLIPWTFRTKFHSDFILFFKSNKNDNISIQVNRIESVQIIESNGISIWYFFQIFTKTKETEYFISEFYRRRSNSNGKMNKIWQICWIECLQWIPQVKTRMNRKKKYDANVAQRGSQKERGRWWQRNKGRDGKIFQFMKYFASFYVALPVCCEYQCFYAVFQFNKNSIECER